MKLEYKEFCGFAFWDTFTWGAAEQFHLPGLSVFFDPMAAHRFAWKFLVPFVMTWCNPGCVMCTCSQSCYGKRALNIVLPRRKFTEYFNKKKRQRHMGYCLYLGVFLSELCFTGQVHQCVLGMWVWSAHSAYRLYIIIIRIRR